MRLWSLWSTDLSVTWMDGACLLEVGVIEGCCFCEDLFGVKRYVNEPTFSFILRNIGSPFPSFYVKVRVTGSFKELTPQHLVLCEYWVICFVGWIWTFEFRAMFSLLPLEWVIFCSLFWIPLQCLFCHMFCMHRNSLVFAYLIFQWGTLMHIPCTFKFGARAQGQAFIQHPRAIPGML